MYQMMASAAMSQMGGGGGLSGGGQSDYLSFTGGSTGDVIFGASSAKSGAIDVNQLLLIGLVFIVVMRVVK